MVGVWCKGFINSYWVKYLFSMLSVQKVMIPLQVVVLNLVPLVSYDVADPVLLGLQDGCPRI